MKTRSQSISESLRDQILSGEIPPGTRLEEEPLADQLRVSRTPIRAALAHLAQQGMLDYVPKRGYLVRSFGLKDVAAAYEVRATLEGMACRLVAESGLSEEATQILTRCIETGDALIAKGRLDPTDFPAYRQMNVEFHETILLAAANPLLRNFVEQTYNMPLTSDRVMFWTDYKIVVRTHDDHLRILDALIDRNVWRVEALMREHIYFSGRYVQRQYLNHSEFLELPYVPPAPLSSPLSSPLSPPLKNRTRARKKAPVPSLLPDNATPLEESNVT